MGNPIYEAPPSPSVTVCFEASRAADRLGLGRTKVYELLRRGDLASVRIGTARRVPAFALAEYVDRLIREPAE